MSRTQQPSAEATHSHVVHGVWRCEECDAGRVCTDPDDLAHQHAEETGHETSAERTVFSTFGERGETSTDTRGELL